MTAIEWTDQTWNPVTGCSKVSAGCDHCYAETLALTRLAGKEGYPGLPWTPQNAAQNVVLRPSRMYQPKKWRKPCMVFVNSMSDLFHPNVPGDYIAEVFGVMADCPQHTFQVLTKRPKRMASWVEKYQPEPLPNVWLGTSIESREYVQRAAILGETPAAVRFISAEPLLGPLVERVPHTHGRHCGCSACVQQDWSEPQLAPCGMHGPSCPPRYAPYRSLDLTDIDWLIVGGESGPGHRPMREEWVRDLRDVCTHEEVAFFFKQWGGIRPKSGGRELDGRTWDEYPTRIGVSA